MLAKLRGFMATEVFKYLFFGVLATLVYMVSRTLIFQLTKQGTLSAVLANAIAIIFAFFTNDIFVFNQETAGMATRFVKFVGARLLTLVLDLALAYFLVDTYPEIIGQFVGHSQAGKWYREPICSGPYHCVELYYFKILRLYGRKSINKKEVVRKCVKSVSYRPPFLI